MTVGFFTTTPPGFIPDDFINIFMAGYLVKLFNLTMINALVLTYVVVGPALFLLGALIFPYNTRRLVISFGKKLINLIRKCFTNPYYFAGLVIGTVIIYFAASWYANYLGVALL